MASFLPLFSRGVVVKGFGRGSKQLGIPTANLDENVISKLPPNLPTGVYYGWSQIGNGPVHEMVTSIGWNPYFKNEKKSMEVHILHSFSDDFYNQQLGVVLLGYIRDQADFTTLDNLILAIKEDIRITKEELLKPACLTFKSHAFFTSNQTDHMVKVRENPSSNL